MRINAGVMGVVLGALLAGGVAQASYIDFSSAAFSGADNKSTFTVSNVGGSGIDVMVVANPTGAKLTYDGTDGLGIDGGWTDFNDEIDGFLPNEVLDVVFLNGPVSLDQIDLSNLYRENVLCMTYSEIGFFTVDGGVSWVQFEADASATPGTQGLKSLAVNYSDVTKISFRSDAGVLSDFTLKGLGVNNNAATSVPEPGMFTLLGTGLFFMVPGFLRKKKNCNN